MNACVFVGPTLSRAEAERSLAATYLPPVSQGDVYRVVSLLAPRAIGIIDGYFQWAPAVWHKELLWAMQQGVRIFGAASMGALRAAELVPFGMVGVGRIYEAYRDGRFDSVPFEDDDEVAIVHGPSESGYLPGSEAMVNIRATLAAAAGSGIIDAATSASLCEIAKAAFYPERNYSMLVERGRYERIPEAELKRLEEWLPAGRVNLKRNDAICMLDAIADFLAEDGVRSAPSFTYERTTLWEDRIAALESALPHHDVDDTGVLAELRLDPARWEAIRADAIKVFVDPDPQVNQTGDHDAEGRLETAAREARFLHLQGWIQPALLERKMLSLLRASGVYFDLRAQAGHKLEHLQKLGSIPEVDEFEEWQLLGLRDWYFSKRLGLEIPHDLDAWMRQMGYADLRELHQVLYADYVFREERPRQRS